MPNNRKIGIKGEDIAAEYLNNIGYKIIGRNVRFSKFCEIDIIALDKNTIVFVEVKTRTSDKCGIPFEAVTKKKYDNIKTGVYTYLQQNPNYKRYRIDAVSVLLFPETRVEHIKNISL